MSSPSKTYRTIEQADEVLDYYEEYILRSPDVLYVAVVKKLDGKFMDFGIEIGKKMDGELELARISEFNAYSGNFPVDKIPNFLPVPSEFELKIKQLVRKESQKFDLEMLLEGKSSDSSSNGLEVRIKTLKEIRKDYEYQLRLDGFKSFVDEENLSLIIADETKSDLEKKESIEVDKEVDLDFDKIVEATEDNELDPWLVLPYGTHKIENQDQNTGVLGAFIRLLEFPDKLFGISNWHVLRGSTKGLGQPIFSVINNNGETIRQKRGHLFWANLNPYNEVGFVEFDENAKSKIETAYSQEKYFWTIGNPKVGMEVRHLGPSSFLSRNNTNIHSINATVRISSTDFENETKIFKNQILIPNFTVGGDSGSLVLAGSQSRPNVVGLNFAVVRDKMVVLLEDSSSTELVEMSVANNINMIFNNEFPVKQEIFISKKEKEITASLAKKFTLNNSELFK